MVSAAQTDSEVHLLFHDAWCWASILCVWQQYAIFLVFKGIPYLNQEEEAQLREQTEERRNQQANGLGTPSFISPSSKGPAHVPDEHKDYINRVM